jgi:hypothetical protein
MSSQLSELEIVQNPALGAYALWQFGLGFQANDSSPATLPIFFLVLPLLFHGRTVQVIGSTRKSSGLALFGAKLGEERENLVAIHGRARLLRALTLESVSFGIHSKLLSLDYAEATVRANFPSKQLPRPTLPARLKTLPMCADKLGYWFSSSGLIQVASTLKVDF